MINTGNQRIDAALTELQEALKAEDRNGNFPNNHASVFILRPKGRGKGTIATVLLLGCDCKICAGMVAKSAGQNYAEICDTTKSAVH